MLKHACLLQPLRIRAADMSALASLFAMPKAQPAPPPQPPPVELRATGLIVFSLTPI